MGVVHKLKENIVEFVLEQKKKDPSSSCRHLTALVNNQFQTKVSKSSINKIIQGANLSSAVGRRSAAPEVSVTKKFQIPATKKEELLSHFDAIAGNKNGDEMSKLARVKYDGPMYEGMGFFLLKAAEWETGARASLTKLIKKSAENSKIAFSDSFETVCDALVSLKMSGCKTPEDIEQYQHHAIWQWNPLKDQSELIQLWQYVDNFQYSTSSLIEYGYDQGQAFYEVKGFKLDLNDGTELLLDAAMTSVWPENIPGHFSQPLQKALSFLSKYLISNNQSLVLKIAPENLAEMADCFENVQGKGLKKIGVLDQANQEIVSFAEIPQRKRTFIAGIWPWQKKFQELAKNFEGAPKAFYSNPWLEEVVYYVEGRPMDALRAVMIRPEKAAEPCLILLTNQKHKPIEEIIEMYTLRWPNWKEYQGKDSLFTQIPFEKGKADLSCDRECTQTRELKTTEEILRNYFEDLHAYCRRHFFPLAWADINLSDTLSGLYGLSGYIEEGKDCLRVRLKASTYLVELEAIKQKFNESGVLDKRGRHIFFDIVSY